MKKAIIEEFIYRLVKDANQNTILKNKVFQWASPIIGFSYDNSLPSKFVQELLKKPFFKENKDKIICVMGEWDSVAEGIILTDESIYVNSPKNKDKQYSVRYDKIKDSHIIAILLYCA